MKELNYMISFLIIKNGLKNTLKNGDLVEMFVPSSIDLNDNHVIKFFFLNQEIQFFFDFGNSVVRRFDLTCTYLPSFQETVCFFGKRDT